MMWSQSQPRWPHPGWLTQPMRDRDWAWVAALVWTAGLASLWFDHRPLSRSLTLGTHALFAAMACCAICATLLAKARADRRITTDELHLWCRLVSRWVYILMYLLAFARLCLYLGESLQVCGACIGRSGTAVVRPLNDFQFYIACCVIPLWLARAIVLSLPLGGRKRSVVPALQAGQAAQIDALLIRQ